MTLETLVFKGTSKWWFKYKQTHQLDKLLEISNLILKKNAHSIVMINVKDN